MEIHAKSVKTRYKRNTSRIVNHLGVRAGRLGSVPGVLGVWGASCGARSRRALLYKEKTQRGSLLGLDFALLL